MRFHLDPVTLASGLGAIAAHARDGHNELRSGEKEGTGAAGGPMAGVVGKGATVVKWP